MVINIGKSRLGRDPISSEVREERSGLTAFSGINPNIAAPPRIIKRIIAMTLMLENQNSDSAKT